MKRALPGPSGHTAGPAFLHDAIDEGPAPLTGRAGVGFRLRAGQERPFCDWCGLPLPVRQRRIAMIGSHRLAVHRNPCQPAVWALLDEVAQGVYRRRRTLQAARAADAAQMRIEERLEGETQ